MKKLPPGLYEDLISRDLADVLSSVTELEKHRAPLPEDSAPEVIGRYLHELLVKALRNVPAEERLAKQVALANKVVELLGQDNQQAGVDPSDEVLTPAELLMSVRKREPQRLGVTSEIRPSLPLRHSDLIVNGPRDLRIGSEVRLELASADSVDLLIAFVKWSGLRIVRRELEEFCQRQPGRLRVLTTTYLGASEVEALDVLEQMGASIRVCYDNRRTRLHAKAWLFGRESGFSTAMVGSSNLSRSALIDGCEWNVRLSAVDNGPILRKFQATFDQYWDEPDFEPYERTRFVDALSERRDAQRDALARAVSVRPYPFQEGVLDALAAERASGHTRNLVVAATGTGKTVVAALDYARVRRRRIANGQDARLLFVAHRREILQQSRATFRAALSDGQFGELLVGDEKPLRGDHVFASIQALHGSRLEDIAPDAYSVLIVDEFHHAEAPTYRRLLEHLEPSILLGLTATPERADGRSVLSWFDNRIAAEIRLWDALDLGLLVPFQYFGVHDGTDLSLIDFRAGRYDVDALEKLYTADDVRARAVLRELAVRVRSPANMRALGFCVSVAHANFMAEFFTRNGLAAEAVTGDTPRAVRQGAIQRLSAGQTNVVFAVDVFNEGVDVPAVDTVLFLRPTESATIFLQQLGRGLRLCEGKDCLTVLDFIGNANRRFRFDRRFRALLGGTHASAARAIDQGFPHLPAGCEIQLDRESQRTVLANIRGVVASASRLVEDLVAMGDVSLDAFLRGAEVELEDVYRQRGSMMALRHRAGFRDGAPADRPETRALCRLLHVDDPQRLDTWRSWLREQEPPPVDLDNRLLLMLYAGLGHARTALSEMSDVLARLWASPDLRREYLELFDVLDDRRRQPSYPLPDLPFAVHATYSRQEISAGLGQIRKGKLLNTQGGVYKDDPSRSDVLYVTLQKNDKEFTPTTLYDDYPISPLRFHWESQSTVRADSETGQRYQKHNQRGWRILLFVREAKRDARGVTMPYTFLGPVKYVSHEREKPMRVTWALERPMPPALFQTTKVAAG